MWQQFSPASRAAILRAQQIALEWKQDAVSPACLFLTLLESADPDSRLGALLLACGLEPEEARFAIENTFRAAPSLSDDDPRLSPDAKRAIERAADEARRTGLTLVEPEHLLLACLHPSPENSLLRVLAPLGWDVPTLRAHQRELNARASSHTSPLDMLTGNGQAAIEAAYAAMRSTWCGRISTAHLLLGVLEDERVRELLREVGASPDDLKTHARAEIRTDSQLATPNKRFDQGAKRSLDRAKSESLTRGNLFIGPEHILLALLPRRTSLKEKFKWGGQPPDVAAPLLAEIDAQKLRDLVGPRLKKAASLPKTTSPDVPTYVPVVVFVFMSFIGGLLILILSRSRNPLRPYESAALGLMLFLLIASALGACWMLIRSEKPRLKAAWVCAFGGFLFGVILTMILFGL